MQGLLSRLKSLSGPQNAVDGNQQTTLIQPQTKVTESDGETGKKILLNNFMKNGNRVLNDDIGRLQNGLISVDSDENIPVFCPSPTDDGLVIDVVMATNRHLSSRSRNRSSTSSPRPLLKNSRTRGSRISLNSVTSERDDLDISGMDSEDELSASRPPAMSPTQAWAAFENSVKTIDNSSPDVFVKKPKPNFISSETFQKVMIDMYGNTEYNNTKGYTVLKQKLNRMAQASTLTSRMFKSAAEKGKEERENEELSNQEDSIDGDNAVEEEVDVTKVFAKRGWKMLKRDVNKTSLESKTQSTKLNWHMLQHTVKQMSNVEKTRQDLYERYGIVPTVQEDGSVTCVNKMFSERARAQLNSNTQDTSGQSKRPLSYQPPPTHLRSQSHSGFHKKGRISAKLPSVGKNKQRPVTAIR